MTACILLAIKDALELVKLGLAPSDAIQMTLANGEAGGKRWSAAERERVNDGVWARDPR